MNTISESHEWARSQDVFTDPDSYQPFDLVDHRRIVGCIDPRDEEQDNLNIMVQTPGGAGGKGYDSTLALTAYNGDHTYTFVEGLQYDSELQRATLPSGHRRCAFIGALAVISDEIITPSDMTQDTFDRLVSRYGLGDTDIMSSSKRIADAARATHEEVASWDEDDLLANVDALYARHQNVVDMKGESRGGYYILNHHPYAGLDRARVHRGEEPLKVQAYHDNVRASMEGLAGTIGMPSEVKSLRLAALLWRTAATRTVISESNPGMRYLNVVPTNRGLQVEQEHL